MAEIVVEFKASELHRFNRIRDRCVFLLQETRLLGREIDRLMDILTAVEHTAADHYEIDRIGQRAARRMAL